MMHNHFRYHGESKLCLSSRCGFLTVLMPTKKKTLFCAAAVFRGGRLEHLSRIRLLISDSGKIDV